LPHIGIADRRLLYPRDFEVVDADGARLAAATSAWLVIDAATHRIVWPESVDLDIPAVARGVGLDELTLRRGSDGAEARDVRLSVRAGSSAVDMLGHVNNSRYVEWICDAFPLHMFRDHTLDRLQIAYTHEVVPGEAVTIRLARTADDPALWAVAGLSRANNSRAFEALARWREM
jgi:acyl-ACP thioesterase